MPRRLVRERRAGAPYLVSYADGQRQWEDLEGMYWELFTAEAEGPTAAALREHVEQRRGVFRSVPGGNRRRPVASSWLPK